MMMLMINMTSFADDDYEKIAEHVQPPAKRMLKRSNLCTNSAILNIFSDLFLKGSYLCLKSTRNPIQPC